MGKKEFISAMLMSMALGFMLCLYAPLELYFNNKNEFWFDLYTLLPILIVMMLIVIFSMMMLFVLSKVLHFQTFYLGIEFIALLGFYVQGGFLTANLPPLDGSEINWEHYSVERIKSILLWVLVITLVVLIIKHASRNNLYKIACLVAVCVTLMLFITILTIYINEDGNERKIHATITTKDQFTMSSESNFIIFMLDALDAGTLNAQIQEYPEYVEVLSDFTFYRNTLGAYSYTKCSVPFILSGEWYEENGSFEDYNVNVYKTSSFFKQLEDREYELNIYETGVPLLDESIFRFSNVIENIEITSYIDFAFLEMRLVGYKYAPFDLKRFCVVYASDFDEFKKPVEGYDSFKSSNVNFYSNVKGKSIQFTGEKQFKMIHIEGAHVPYKYDKDVNIIDEEEGTYEQNVQACMTMIKAYLQKLKDSGVYDNSVIIIMSDHGYLWDTKHYHYGRQNPAFLIKGINEQHVMEVSEAPISYEDLQGAYIKLLDGTVGEDVFDWKEGDKRIRRFLWYFFTEDFRMIEYLQDGDAGDPSTMYPTGTEYILEE